MLTIASQGHLCDLMIFWTRSHRSGCTRACPRSAALGAAWCRAAELTWAAVWPGNTRAVLQKEKKSQDLVQDICKCFCVKTWGEDVRVLHASTAPSWAEQDSENAVLQEGTQASLLPILLDFIFYLVLIFFVVGIFLFGFFVCLFYWCFLLHVSAFCLCVWFCCPAVFCLNYKLCF